MFPLHFYRQKHPVNLLLLGVFTVAISFAVGMTCAFTSGNYCIPTMYSVPNLFLSPLMPPLIVLIHYIYMAIVSHYAISLFVTMYGNWTCECSWCIFLVCVEGQVVAIGHILWYMLVWVKHLQYCQLVGLLFEQILLCYSQLLLFEIRN